jgi:hypothetical protein
MNKADLQRKPESLRTSYIYSNSLFSFYLPSENLSQRNVGKGVMCDTL